MSIHPVRTGAKPIVVGIDGSDACKAALVWAAGQAELTRTKLVAVTVATLAPVPHPLSEILPRGWYLESPDDWPQPQPGWPTWQAGARSVLETTVNDVMGERLSHDVRLEVLAGHPARVLASVSGGASLIVVGSRGHRALTGLLLGSVSEYLTTHARCPVVVIRPGRARRAA